jgi:ATP-dependent 26S proteasome regulatory subunit
VAESILETWGHNIFVLANPDVNYEELARCTEDFNGAQLKAVCVEVCEYPVK